MELEQIYNRYQRGESLRQIGLSLGVSHVTLSRHLRAANYLVVPKRRKLAIVSFACELCHKVVERYVVSGSNKFCSKRCYNSYRLFTKTSSSTRQLTKKSYLKIRAQILLTFPKCVLCGLAERLHIHHIIPRRTDENGVESISNLITLCIRCHCRIKGKELEYANFFIGLVSKSGELLETPNGLLPRAISSQAAKGVGFAEGSETIEVSPNNNPLHECPTRKGRYSPSLQETVRITI